jgi:hypothetical protein
MPRAIPVPIRRDIVERHQAGQTLCSVARGLGMPYNTVRRRWRRYRRQGEAGLIPDYQRRGRPRASRLDRMYRAACWLKRHHPTWGARLIHDLLRQRWPDRTVPSPRSLQCRFRAARLNRPCGCPRDRDDPPRDGLGPHEHWSDFAAEADRAWMLGVLQGKVPVDDLTPLLTRPADLEILVDAIADGGLRRRNKALAIFAHRRGIPKRTISRFEAAADAIVVERGQLCGAQAEQFGDVPRSPLADAIKRLT